MVRKWPEMAKIGLTSPDCPPCPLEGRLEKLEARLEALEHNHSWDWHKWVEMSLAKLGYERPAPPQQAAIDTRPTMPRDAYHDTWEQQAATPAQQPREGAGQVSAPPRPEWLGAPLAVLEAEGGDFTDYDLQQLYAYIEHLEQELESCQYALERERHHNLNCFDDRGEEALLWQEARD